jgi:outer membrane protein OmpA-like peptidoglycan-associated protein
MLRGIRNARLLRCLLACCGPLAWGCGPAVAQQGPSVEQIVERLRDRAEQSGTVSRRNDVLDELRRNRASGLTFEQRKRALEWAKLQPMIDLQIPFEYNKADLSAQALPELQKLMEALPKASPRSDFLIIGHTDSSGSEDYNQTLSENRAKKVLEFISRSSNISSNRLSTYGFGSQFPLTPATPWAAANRRVQIVNIGPPLPYSIRPPAEMLRVGSLFNETALWGLLVMLMLTGFASRFWTTARSIQVKLTEGGERVAKLQGVLESVGHTVQNLGDRTQKKLESVESNVARLIGTVGEVRREAHKIEKHVDSLETKSAVVTTKVSTMKLQVDTEVDELHRIADQIMNASGSIDRTSRQVDHLEHEVHSVGLVKRFADQVKNKLGVVDRTARQIDHLEHEIHGLEKAHRLELQRIADQLKSNRGGVERNARHIDHLEHEVLGLHGPEKHDGYKWGDHDSRRRAIAELQSADRKIEKLMDETIQIEAGHRIIYIPERDALEMAQEYEEHHRKLIDAAQDIFRDIRKYLAPTAVQAMEAKNEQIDWSRGELFANTSSSEAARAYHQQVRDYLIKLKEAISRSLHEIA